VLSIPKLDLKMPIYLGATWQHMADGAAQMTETSLPIGGKNTNCVIAGHRGWNGAAYFLHIPKLEIGDTVIITNLWETLTYEVVETKIIAPYDVESIHIQPNRDLITLLTCHPPATGGRERYLVYCERVLE
jgi:sortase A